MTDTTIEAASEKLYAGKYKTVEDLESAVIGKDKEYTKLSNEIHELKNKYAVPDDYILADDIKLGDSDLNEIKYIAKNANLSQSQFLAASKLIEEKNRKQQQLIDDEKKAIGEEKLKLIDGYVTQYYPEKIRPHILDALLKDREAMSQALDDRSKLLNNSIPGMKKGSITMNEKYDGQNDLLKAAQEHHADPRSKDKREKYLTLCRETGHAKMEKEKQEKRD